MSLETLQAPFFINATVNNLPLIVSSSAITASQWRLTTQIYQLPNTGSALTTINTFPNNSGSAVIDIARICNDYLEYDDTVFEKTGSYSSDTNVGTFVVVMGEQYADSPSGSVVQYNGLGAVGNPAFTMSFNSTPSGSVTRLTQPRINLYPAVNEYSNLQYDWPSGSYVADVVGTGSRPFLTNDPAYNEGIVNDTSTFISSSVKKAFYYDFETIALMSTYNNICDLSLISATIYQDLATVPLYTDANYETETDGKLLYVGIGPANLSASNATAASIIDGGNWGLIEYDFEFANGDNRLIRIENANCGYYDKPINPTALDLYRKSNVDRGRTRFAWVNKYGTWDYISIPYPVTKQAKISRKEYIKPQLQWQEIGNDGTTASYNYSSTLFDKSSRGKDNYYTEYVDNYKITTDWLTTSQANWLTELFDSPSVYIQNQLYIMNDEETTWTSVGDGGFVPVNIKNGSYTWKSNRKGQKTFQYDIEFELSKVNIGRR